MRKISVLNTDEIVMDANVNGASVLHVNTLVAEVQRLSRKLGDWMKYVPEGWEPIEGCRQGNKFVICGDPVEANGDVDDPNQHNCDGMGCSSVNHVIWRGELKTT